MINQKSIRTQSNRRIENIVSYIEEEYLLDLDRDNNLCEQLKELTSEYINRFVSRLKSCSYSDFVDSKSMMDNNSYFMISVRSLLYDYKKLN